MTTNITSLRDFGCFGQEKLWTAADKQSTIDQLIRTRDAVVKETENLTPEQWAFRESPNEPRNMHQVLIYQWGHTDRHLRQISKVKNHASYPR